MILIDCCPICNTPIDAQHVVEEVRRRVRDGSVTCPHCNGRMTLRGSYLRKIRQPGPLPDVRVVRGECSGCGLSHSLIPSFLAPRSPYPQQVREGAVQRVARGQSLNGLSASLGVPRVTIQRWVRARRLREPRVVAAVRALLAHLNEELHGDLEELVARASRALGFIALCDLG